MTDSQTGKPNRAALEQLRGEYLDKVRDAFGKALDLVRDFREMAERHPDDVELRGLVEILCGVVKQLLNTVTVKVAANGMAADWDRLFECRHDDGERDSAGTQKRD